MAHLPLIFTMLNLLSHQKPLIAATLPPLDSIRINELRDSAMSGNMDSAAVLATHWAPPNKSSWLTDKERLFWLAVASYNGNGVALNQDLVLKPGNRELRVALLRKAKGPSNDRQGFAKIVNRRLRELGASPDSTK
jgi:hypothetical protein